MDLFSSVSANPREVIGVFPPIIAGEWSNHDEIDDSDSKTTDQPESEISVATSVPQGGRTSIDSVRRSRDGESDSGSILSKHTEISTSGPLGTIYPTHNLIYRRKGFT